MVSERFSMDNVDEEKINVIKDIYEEIINLYDDIYGGIAYFTRLLDKKTMKILKKIYKKIPKKQKKILEKNALISFGVSFAFISFVIIYLFSWGGIITQLIIRGVSNFFGIWEGEIYICYSLILLEGESFKQYYYPEEPFLVDFLTLIIMFYVIAISILIVLFFIMRIMKRKLSYIGFRNPFEDKAGIVFVLLFSGFQVVALMITPSVLESLLSSLEKEYRWLYVMATPILEMNISPKQVYFSTGIDLLMPLIIPFFYILGMVIYEEMAFRGIIQTVFMEKMGKSKGLALTSIIFTSMHTQYLGNPLYYSSIFINSLLYGYLYLRKKSIMTPILLHFLHNFIAWSYSNNL
jgi:membrane protease YdiL (CAAX protease family)